LLPVEAKKSRGHGNRRSRRSLLRYYGIKALSLSLYITYYIYIIISIIILSYIYIYIYNIYTYI
jgi:hypothetical protein